VAGFWLVPQKEENKCPTQGVKKTLHRKEGKRYTGGQRYHLSEVTPYDRVHREPDGGHSKITLTDQWLMKGLGENTISVGMIEPDKSEETGLHLFSDWKGCPTEDASPFVVEQV